uniref:Leucine-rich repeat and IQ domain-containing protein 1 n=1 Tax=Naja naja TaxID=35670 RepID=A0A8C6XT55_NAJNA
MSELSDNTIELKTDQDISSNNIADGYSLTDANDIPINFSFQEVEEKCKQEYQYWLEKQTVLEKEKMNQLKAKKDMEISQNEEEKKRRYLRQEELENERMNLEMFKQQQTMMEEELLKEEQTWKKQLKEHEEFIMKLHTQIEEEKKAFEEQKAKERQQLMEQQNNAAIKIQTTFRAFMVHKRFAPVLKKKREEREKKRENKQIMEKEMKEKEERWKRKESIIHYLHVQLDFGESGKTAGSSASENSKIDFAPKEINEEVNHQWAKGENSNNLFEQPLVSDSVETKRLAWMKTYKPWSRIYQEHQTKKMVERSKPRKYSADQKPPLSATMLIQAGPWSSLQQVTTVNFQDLPGCSLSTLSQCAKLQSLSLRRCGLLALQGLSICKDLKYIDVEENNIQMINCENLENLCILILNKNNISSLHGLYGCSNLLNLELSYNKITRIGKILIINSRAATFSIVIHEEGFAGNVTGNLSSFGGGYLLCHIYFGCLETLKKLQRLAVDHNQLISTKGLSATPTLLYLDCSFNHLTHIEGIENCGLLQILKLQGNNLNEFPKLENHVLLRELYLEDNNISRLGKLTDYWLPLLQILFISQNSLTQLVSLFSYVSLEKLNISNNCLLDLKTLIQCLEGCDSLRELSLLGNPLLQEDNWRCCLLKNLPTLKILNDENISCDVEKVYEKVSKSEAFAAFCQAQIQEIICFNYFFSRDKFTEDSVQLQCWYFEKLMKLSIEHRYAHEYGVLNITKTEEPKKQADHLTQDFIEKNNFFTSGVKENKQDSLNTPERWITSGHTHVESINSFMTVPETDENHQNSIIVKSIYSTIIGTVYIFKVMFFSFIYSSAAIIIQSCWRGYRVRKEIIFYTRLHLAATVIQSAWRSYCLRRKIVSCEKKNNHFLDRHKAATILQALWKGFRLRKKLASALAAVKTDEFEDDYKEINVDEFVFNEAVIEKEWPALDSNCFLSQTVLCSDQLPSPKVTCHRNFIHLWPLFIPLETSRSDLLILTCSCRLDPAVRLALFKNNENKHPPMKPPKKPQTTKIGYFEGRQRNFILFIFCPVRREDTDLEVVSLTSGSTLTQNREKNNQPHRHSAESSSKLGVFFFLIIVNKIQIT